MDAERARIATELHDIVSHNVSLMVVQAGAAREVLATMPDDAAAAMSAVETAGRNTMTELRHLLGLLAPAQNGDDEPYGMDLSPQPSLSRLGPLIDRIAFAGLPWRCASRVSRVRCRRGSMSPLTGSSRRP
ncbi:histidine kinase dimerization/phosphoacceptor domain-containing protein [Streptomyces fradiae]|uniref:histidine kinase dimerization/phosphoacceptor domain-containing protein n=1 Tax=Streptomyces fradiae TaxID=1906 RepID=UPI00380F6A4B